MGSSSVTRVTDTPPVTSVSTTENTDSWKYRRRFMLAITIFDMAVAIIGLLWAKQESVAQIAEIMAFGSLTSIFGFYVAGAVWDDHSNRQFQLQSLTVLRQTQPGSDQGDHKDGDNDKGP